MWELYDKLLEQIPAGEPVVRGQISPLWTTVETTHSMGMAMTPPQPYTPISLRGSIAGMDVRKLAGYIKSWNFHEAALGLAAVNSFCNQLPPLSADPRMIICKNGERQGIFGGFEKVLKGKKVTMIGHGPHLDALEEMCCLTVLERLPRTRDLPDTACEYILPHQDYVFITATTLENKTLPRLLELTKNCFTVIWGPSTPLCDILFDAGADALLGQVISSPGETLRIAGEGGLFLDLNEYTTSVSWFKNPAAAAVIG